MNAPMTPVPSIESQSGWVTVELFRMARYFLRLPDGNLLQEIKWLHPVGMPIQIGPITRGLYEGCWVEVVPFERFGHIYYAFLHELVAREVYARIRELSAMAGSLKDEEEI